MPNGITSDQVDGWIDALESGCYTQYFGGMSNRDGTRFCVLGVLGKINDLDLRNNLGAEVYNLFMDCPKVGNLGVADHLWVINDRDELSFLEIAEKIRELRKSGNLP